MDCTFTQLSYQETGFFSNIVSAYIGNDEKLKPFLQHPVSEEGIAEAIKERQKFPTNRKLLVDVLHAQYQSLPVTQKVNNNIALLLDENTFTVCTAHQPAIFTGNLFFIYKIVHTIRLAAHLTEKYPGKNFVPVFYMGCEDADLEELGHVHLNGEKLQWDTNQQGAVGRMKTSGLEKLISRIEGQLSVEPYGSELVALLKECYLGSADIQTATLKLVNRLFGEFGLLVLVPDNAAVKKVMIPVFEDELMNHRSTSIVSRTIEELSAHFKVQAQPREINLFYLHENTRARIEQSGGKWNIVDTTISFDRKGILKELNEHPDRFSPNVILRGLLQETILPDVAFIGGGGEIAYWLELKGVFDQYHVPFPVLVVRNSFLVIEAKWKEKLDRLRLGIPDIFREERDLLNDLVKRDSEKKLTLAEEITDVANYYNRLKTVAGEVDDTLTVHVAALQTRAIKPLHELEKKLLRAERKKFEVHERQLHAVKQALFPNNGLQERVENFMPYYAKWGKDFITMILEHSPALEQRFTVITCN